jgi:hypothetical protein
MYELVFRYHVNDLGSVTPELLLAIFWHESRFQNIGQSEEWGGGRRIGGHGWGFGQVEVAVISLVNNHFHRNYPAGPLTDQQSIEITSLALHLQLTFPQKISVPQALHAYATAGGRMVALRHDWRPGPTVSGWLAAAETLRFLRHRQLPAAYGNPEVVQTIWTALRQALGTQRTNESELSRTLPMAQAAARPAGQ